MLQTGLYLSLVGPSFVYVRFRCARCKRVGEQLVEEEKWDPAILTAPAAELADTERRRFEQLGPITAEEMLSFHERLDGIDDLDAALPPREAAEEPVEGDEQ